MPAVFRFECKEVFIRKEPDTGDIILSRKPGSWETFFKLIETIDVPEDFMTDRDNETPSDRDMF